MQGVDEPPQENDGQDQEGSGPSQGKGMGGMHGDWRNHLKRMMDEIKKVQDLPKVRERKHVEPSQENDGRDQEGGPTQGKGKEACRDWRTTSRE